MTPDEAGRQIAANEAEFERLKAEHYRRQGELISAVYDEHEATATTTSSRAWEVELRRAAGVSYEMVAIYQRFINRFGGIPSELFAPPGGKFLIAPHLSTALINDRVKKSERDSPWDPWENAAAKNEREARERCQQAELDLARKQLQVWGMRLEPFAIQQALQDFYEAGKITDLVMPRIEEDAELKREIQSRIAREHKVSREEKNEHQAAISEVESFAEESVRDWKVSRSIRGDELVVRLTLPSPVARRRTERRSEVQRRLASKGDDFVFLRMKESRNQPGDAISPFLTMAMWDSLRGVQRQETPQLVDARQGRTAELAEHISRLKRSLLLTDALPSGP